jgi:hypothetical protein
MHPNLLRLRELHAGARNDLMRRFLEAAIAMHPVDRLPPRDALRPEAWPGLLPHLAFTKVERQGDKLRFRLAVVGQMTGDTLGLKLNNRYMDEIPESEMHGINYSIEDRIGVVASGLAYYRYGPPRLKYKADFARIELCHTPMADDGATVNHILSLTAFEGLT